MKVVRLHYLRINFVSSSILIGHDNGSCTTSEFITICIFDAFDSEVRVVELTRRENTHQFLKLSAAYVKLKDELGLALKYGVCLTGQYDSPIRSLSFRGWLNA